MLKWGENMSYYKRSHVHYSKSAMKIVALVFMLVGVTFLAVGIVFAIHQTQLKNRCTLEVNAIISDILSKDERHENDDGHVSYSTVYTPVYSYNVDGQLYTTHSNTYSSNIRYRRGQTIQIFCDPDDPETFYAPNDTTNTILTVVFCGLGGLFAIIAIVLIIVLIHIKKKQKSEKNFAENELYEENNYPYDE